MTIQSNTILNQAGTGAPDFPQGYTATGMKHLHYYVSAASTGYSSGANQDIIYDTQVSNSFSTEYNAGTGVFTASEAGIYLIQASVSLASFNIGEVLRARADFNINGTNTQAPLGDAFFSTDQDGRIFGFSGMLILNMSATDTVKVVGNVTTNSGNWSILSSGSDRGCVLTIAKIA